MHSVKPRVHAVSGSDSVSWAPASSLWWTIKRRWRARGGTRNSMRWPRWGTVHLAGEQVRRPTDYLHTEHHAPHFDMHHLPRRRGSLSASNCAPSSEQPQDETPAHSHPPRWGSLCGFWQRPTARCFHGPPTSLTSQSLCQDGCNNMAFSSSSTRPPATGSKDAAKTPCSTSSDTTNL